MNLLSVPPSARPPLPELDEDTLEISRPPALPRLGCQLVGADWTVEAGVSNLSLQGLFVPTAQVLTEGSEVVVRVGGATGRAITARGFVAWCGRGPLGAAAEPGLAVRFGPVYEGREELARHTKLRHHLLKARHLPLDVVVPLVFLPTAKIAGCRDRIAATPLSPVLERMVQGYEAVGMKHRQRFLWLSTRVGMACEMLPGVHPELVDLVNDIKTMGAMIDVLMDDLADEVRDRARLEGLLALLDYRITGVGSRPRRTGDPYADFAVALWEEMWTLIERLPRYGELRHLLCFDWQQVVNSMRFSLLVSEMPAVQNLPEHDAYAPHNMHMMCNATLDLMCSPGFDLADLPALRRAARVAQRMGRIGNMLTTWEREIMAGDFSSGVFPYVLHRRLVKPADLHCLPREELARRVRAAHVERFFLLDWENLRAYLYSLQEECRTVSLPQFAQGLDELLLVQLASHGLV